MPVKKARKSARKPAPKSRTKPRPKARKTPSPEALMAVWQKTMSPSEGHRRLEPLAGSWKARTTFVMEPGGRPDVSEGRSENRFILGGRYLEQRYTGSSMGMPFEGVGYTGYDNAQKTYVGTWMDSFGTGLMTSRGAGRPKDDLIRSTSEAVDPFGQKLCFDCALKIQDRDHHSFEMWLTPPGGKRYRSMLIEYVRG